MKKALSIALALVMVLSLSVTAFADSHTDISASGDIAVQAKIVPMISAQVDWGGMQFTYYEEISQWDANNTNGVTVTNTTTTGRSIDTSYSYARYNDKGETTMTAGWVENNESLLDPGPYNVLLEKYVLWTPQTAALDGLGTTLEPNGTQQFWLTFTTNAHVSDLTTAFAQVGTLTVTIAAH